MNMPNEKCAITFFMKTLIFIICCLSLSAFSRELYPEEQLVLPSDDYKLILNLDITMPDTRKEIHFYKGKIVKQPPKSPDLFYCTLSNARSGSEVIKLKKGSYYKFSNEDGFAWENYFTGRIWRKWYFMWDNDDVQYFACNNLAIFHSTPEGKKDPITYAKIKSAVGRYLTLKRE
jgi:hypothetical protein